MNESKGLVEFLIARLDEMESGVRTALKTAEYGVSQFDLDDIAAKRRIIDDCTRILSLDGWEYSDAPDLAEATLRHMAAPYADHPDWRPEWSTKPRSET